MRLDSLAVSAALALATTVWLTGCGSYWDLREGQKLAISGKRLNYYIDEDGDGWGRPDSAPTPLDAPDPSKQLTASNALDCDEQDRLVTGRTGALCPTEIGGGSPEVSGQVVGQSEFVATWGSSPTLHFSEGGFQCEAWAGGPTPDVPETAHYGLASLETANEYNSVVDWLAGLTTGPMSFWVDLVWNGDLEAGQWEWPDGTVPTYVPACGGVEPHPADLYPDLVLGLPEADETLAAHLPHMRLALVYDGTEWCRGVPEAKGGPYGPRDAHVVCERYTPSLRLYEEAADGGSDKK